MALARTDVGLYESKSANGTAAFATGSFTPPANSVLLAAVLMIGSGTTGDLGTPTISGGGLTYTIVPNGTAFGTAAWSIKLAIFSAPVGDSPSSMTITVDDDNNQNIDAYTVSVIAFTGADGTTPVFGGVTSGSTNIGDGEEKQTLSATPASEDVTLNYIGLDTSSGPPKASLAAGWTKIHEGKLSGEGGLHVARREGSTSTEVKVTDVFTTAGSFAKGMMISLIVKAATTSDVTISVPAATATAAGIAPTPAVAIAAAPAPAVASASPPVPALRIAASPGAATAAAPAPSPAVAIGAAPASAAASAPSPVPAVAPGVPAAQAVAGAPAPAAAVSVGLPPATAVASAPSPVPAVLIGAPPALATASAPPPAVVVEEAPATPLDLDVPTRLVLEGRAQGLYLKPAPSSSLAIAGADAYLRLQSTDAALEIDDPAATLALAPDTTTVVLDDRAEELILDG